MWLNAIWPRLFGNYGTTMNIKLFCEDSKLKRKVLKTTYPDKSVIVLFDPPVKLAELQILPAKDLIVELLPDYEPGDAS